MYRYRIHFQWSIDIENDNIFYGEYRYQNCQYLFKVSLAILPLNDYDIRFFSIQTTLRKNYESTLHDNDMHI